MPVNITDQIMILNVLGAIVKPVDSQGGRGVANVQRPEDLLEFIEHALTFSRDGKAIVEEYVVGSEFSINAFLRDFTLFLPVANGRASLENPV